MRKHVFIFSLGLFLSATAEESSKTQDLKKVSESMGHLIGKNLQVLGLPLDFDSILVGLKAALEGKPSPLSEEECVDAIACLQEDSDAKVMEASLALSEKFLKETSAISGVISLLDGKLLYLVSQKGNGEEISSLGSCLLRYKGKTAEGEEIPIHEEMFHFEEAPLALQQGLIGMKEGEVRTLYIHPALGFLEPYKNSTTILEVEMHQTKPLSDPSSLMFPKEIDLQLQ